MRMVFLGFMPFKNKTNTHTRKKGSYFYSYVIVSTCSTKEMPNSSC